MNGKQKKYLRGLAHDMRPLVHVGQRGLGPSVVKQIDAGLSDHELIKVKLSAEAPLDRKQAAAQIEQELGCTVAGSIGRVLILYRRNPDNPRIEVPSAGDVEESAEQPSTE